MKLNREEIITLIILYDPELKREELEKLPTEVLVPVLHEVETDYAMLN